MSHPPPGYYPWIPAQPPPEPPRREMPRHLAIALVVIGVILAVLSVAGALAIVYTGGITQTTPTPVATAEPDVGQEFVPSDPEVSDPSQPAAGQVAVPDLSGMDGATARATVTRLGFTSVTARGTDGKEVAQEGQWRVVAQSPAAGQQATTDTPIVLILAGNAQQPPAQEQQQQPSAQNPSQNQQPVNPQPLGQRPSDQQPSDQQPQSAPVGLRTESHPRYATCEEANAHGYGNYRKDEHPEYKWYVDRDGDGVVCAF
ncbi:excalibur calcium-binding domain-containing protein [Spongiactinospora gelatinilytica]|uniref:excalibur calcium-binding domain-containing protein n=1 Tax=Spongiactinospora gelatinilytica TaxID=2666298 RepID=UPI0018F2B9ED|nr:excalibur calcium-binding domain-containing protein [Spongiactinospora gelatinilytica]